MQNSFEKSLSPFLQFNALVTKTAESAVSQHLQSVEAFTKLSLDNFYAGLNTRTITDAISFAQKQPEYLKKTSELFVKESKAYASLTNNIYDTSQELYSKNLKEMYLKVPKIEIEPALFDLGKSIIIRQGDPQEAAPETHSKQTKSKIKAKPAVKKAKTTPKSSVTAKKSITETETKSPTVSSASPKKTLNATVKPKAIKKPVNVKTDTKNLLKTEIDKASVKTTASKPVQTPKVNTTKAAIKASEKMPTKQQTKIETAVSTPSKKNIMDSPVWDKPKSHPQITLPSDGKTPIKLSAATKSPTKINPKSNTTSKKINDKK